MKIVEMIDNEWLDLIGVYPFRDTRIDESRALVLGRRAQSIMSRRALYEERSCSTSTVAAGAAVGSALVWTSIRAFSARI